MMLRKIQTVATTIVTRVKTSPDLVPKALEPPTPPKAPARPPPLPRWIRTRQIMNSEEIISRTLSRPVKNHTGGVLANGGDCGGCPGRGAGSGLAGGGDLAGGVEDAEE